MSTPKTEGFSMPAEWAPHRATWIAKPYRQDEWSGHLTGALAEWEQLAAQIGESEEVWQLDRDRHQYGDSWVRDTAPVLLKRGDELAAVYFNFNGWGGRYLMGEDAKLGKRLADELNVRTFHCPMTLEGGALEVDGEGTLLTTRDCVLNANRGKIDESKASELLKEYLGIEKVIFADACLAGDHTDGHIDTLARFIRPGEIVCMLPESDQHRDYEMCSKLADKLSKSVDATGRQLKVHTIDTPEHPAEDEPIPRSYCNYCLTNRELILPTYGLPSDELVARQLGELIADRKLVSLSAKELIMGGGAFHCLTQQVPA